MYELYFKKYVHNPKEIGKNPYEENFKKGQLSYINGLLFRSEEIGYDENGDDPFYYKKFVEVSGEELAKTEETARKVKVRNIKGIIKELSEFSIEVHKIIPLFSGDYDDFHHILEQKEFKYVPNETEEIFIDEDGEYAHDSGEEIFNYVVDITRWDYKIKQSVKERYVVKELDDLLNLL
ncbi:hypothetical protein H3N56_11240 [Cetobacterium sp. 2A]|uniref:hypothetical protein n=1 Tax=Cetobacterium sp. 2A TaxID=2754723 RepID=UPI00163CAFC9|nr:hypothetical protein [Cetobacterium sp. 2A]MBC2857007.1 hypothetical protein [Cetobacterium sp. 2A]